MTLGIFDEATDFWVVDLREKYPEYLHIIEEFIKNFFTKIGEAAAEFDFHAEMVCYTSILQRQMRQKSRKTRNEAELKYCIGDAIVNFYATLGNIRLDKDIQRECCIYVRGI